MVWSSFSIDANPTCGGCVDFLFNLIHNDQIINTLQLERKPHPFPTLRIKRKVGDIDDFKFEDFIIEGYKPYPKIQMDMAI